MANFVRHEACEKCGSSDGKAVYDDNSFHCFVCLKNTKPSEEHKAENPSRNKKRKESVKVQEVKTKEKEIISEEDAKDIKDNTSSKGKGFRNIRDDIYTPFGVRHSFDEETGEVTEQYYPCTQNGKLVGYKIREIPKDFRSIGRTGATVECFMQFKFTRGGKYLILTEGECLLSETEVLTENGWVTLENYNGGKVMQANGEFAEPLAKIYKDYSGDMISYTSGSYKLDMTPQHNMIRLDRKTKEPIKVYAKDTTKQHLNVPRTVKFNSNSDDLMARIQVMLSADFSFRKEGDIYGCLKKQRKIDRAIQLLDAVGVRYTVNTDSRGYASFFIHRNHGLDVSKEFSYKRDMSNARTIIDEILYWDGNSVPNRNQIEYSSVIEHNAKFIQTCAHLCGYTSTIINRSKNKYSWFKVSILFGKQTSSTQKGFNTYSYEGKVACLTMPEGTLLVRFRGSISVTGNCDALSAYQMLKDYNSSRGNDYEVAVVSATTGAQSAKQLAHNYKFFDSFEQIIVSYDNDVPGQEAIEKVIKALPKGKVKIMQMRLKDANEYLKQGKHKEFVQDFYSSKMYAPVGVLPSSGIYDRILEQTAVPKVPFPDFTPELNEMFVGGMPLGHTINIAADTGIGKTTLVNEFIYFWVFNSPHKVGIVSMELDAGQYGEVLLSRHLSKKLALMGDIDEKVNYLKTDKVKSASDQLFLDEHGNDRFYLLDNRDGTIEEIQDTVEELVVSCGCKVIVLDPLQDILDGLSNEEQALFMKWVKGFQKSHGVLFIFINHMRKSENSGEQDIMGSSTIIKSASANIILKRDKLAENPIVRNTTEIFVPKNRVCGLTGPAGGVFYENLTHTLHNLAAYLAEHGITEF